MSSQQRKPHQGLVLHKNSRHTPCALTIDSITAPVEQVYYSCFDSAYGVCLLLFMIRTSELTKRFGKLAAVDRLTMEIESGELFGFLGPNGAGKTTTINMLTGLIRPTSGAASICGYDVQSQSLQAKSITGLMPDTPQLYDTLTGRQFVRLIADLYEVPPKQSEKRMEGMLDMLDLRDAGRDLIKSYSYGMQKKILLVAVLIHAPRVLFLDEPTSGLDPRAPAQLRRCCVNNATSVVRCS